MVGFLTEPEPPRGVALPVAPGVLRLVAANPGPFTYHGTNTYLIEDGAGGISVLDPGPDEALHVDAIVAAGAGRIRRILLSHTHADHHGAVAALQARTGAPSWGWHRSYRPDVFVPDHPLHDGDRVAGLAALFTPGHAADHVCFARPDGVLFSADHVMGWSTSVVSPPEGDMRDYCASLELLLTRDDRLYLPGHGPAIPSPLPFVRGLLAHRRHREQAIARVVRQGPVSIASLVGLLYVGLDPGLLPAAGRSVHAHLLKLQADGQVLPDGALWCWAGTAPPFLPGA